MNTIKPGLAALASVVLVCTLDSCKRPSDTKLNSAPSNVNAAANSSGPDAPNLGRLDRFVGTWGGYSSRTSAVSGQISLDTQFMKTTVKRVTPDTVALEGSIWQTKATLKYDATSQKYLLSCEAESFPRVADLPMTFSETTGFSGEKTFTNQGKEYNAKATIKDDNKGQPDWDVTVTQKKDRWMLSITLGKEQ